MTTTLLTFLGRTPKSVNGYRKTSYVFSDGTIEEVTFFGWALMQRIKPKRLVILGTSGSMWDHLFESDIDFDDAGLERRSKLIDNVEKKKVTQEQLNELTPMLSEHFACHVSLVIIPYCEHEEEQIELLKIISEQIESNQKVHLDVTHGFRHLPMLALLSSLHIRLVHQAEIQSIWYGSYDPDTGKAKVHDLVGLLKIADWLQALSAFDKDGDYRTFAPLLKQSGMEDSKVIALKEAGYYENILNVGDATGKLRQATENMDSEELRPDAKLLLPLVKKRLDWVNESKQFDKQCKLGEQALERGDYLRSTLYAYEAVITRLCQLKRVNINDFSSRENARKSYESELRNSDRHNTEKKDYNLLKSLRNQIAHGSRSTQGNVQKILLNEGNLHQALVDLLQKIKNHQLPKESL